MMARAILALVIAILSLPVFAMQPGERLSNPRLEARARSLSHELRCMVCQNQSIDDSDAPLAKDLRLLVRERLAAGDSDEQIKSFLVERYGTFVLLRPPLSLNTVALWVGPFGVLLFSIGAVAWMLRRRHFSTPRPLTEDEEEKLRTLLACRPVNLTKS